MTRITLSEFKLAARDRSARRSVVTSDSRPPVSPTPQAQAAVRRFHREGVAAATMILHQSFDRSSYWGPAGRASARGWANAIKDCFDVYARFAGADDRPPLLTPLKRDVPLGENVIGVAPDVVLIDPEGYVGRLVLWDTPVPSQAVVELLAAPIVSAMDAELGAGRTAGVEIWHLRSEQQFYVPADVALDRLDEAESALSTYID